MATSFKRLFDVLYFQQENTPNAKALNEKDKNTWINHSTQDCLEIINALSRGLYRAGIKKGDMIAIIAQSSPQWLWIDMAVSQLGAILVPIYPNITIEEYHYILNHSESVLCFVGDKTLYQKIASIKKEIPSLREIYCLQELADIPYYKHIEINEDSEADIDIQNIKDSIDENDLATIIYTSGTTGTPKGVMLSHKNIVSNAIDAGSVIPLKAYDTTVTMLPVCHIFERTVLYLCMFYGASIHFIGLESIGDDLKSIQPHFFSTVPRILEKIYEKIVSKGNSLTGFKKKIFFWAHDLANAYDTPKSKSLFYKAQLAVADKLVFVKWREATGGNLFGIVSGAAALQPKLARIFSAAGIPIKEGYGQTESSPVISVNQFTNDGNRIGTVGPIIPNVQCKIAEDGEICVKGTNVMLGYYKQPTLTSEAIDTDGWLHTGDIGIFVDNKFLKITDRKKELFKTSAGKYIAPQVIENKYKESFYIDQIMIVGENKKTISALIVPAFDNLNSYCKDIGIETKSRKELINHPEVKKLFAKIRDEFNKEFSDIEKVKKFALLDSEWNIEGGEMTPTLKLKRKNIHSKYAQIIAELYNEE